MNKREAKYSALFDDGHNYTRQEFYSYERLGSNKLKDDAIKEYNARHSRRMTRSNIKSIVREYYIDIK